MANTNFDLDALTEIETTHHRKGGQSYDLAYSEKTNKFRVSTDAWDKLGMRKHGFKVFVHPKGAILLALVPEDEATMYSRRYKQETGEPLKKGAMATNSKLRTQLDKAGLNGVNNFALESVGEKDGISFYRITKWDEEKGSSLDYVKGTIAPSVEENGQEVEDSSDIEEEDDFFDMDDDNEDEVEVGAEAEGDDKDPFSV